MRSLHPIAGALALATASLFWVSTVLSEAFGPESLVIQVKTAIPWGLPVLILALMGTGISGNLMVRKSGRAPSAALASKIRRMPFLAANGLLVLVPSAFFLAWKASLGQIDGAFYMVQALELVAGAINITLMARNAIEGRRLSRHVRSTRKQATFGA
jgi:hypothetical protein